MFPELGFQPIRLTRDLEKPQNPSSAHPIPTALPERSITSKHGFQFLAKILPGPTGAAK